MLLGGRYELRERIAMGGMGEVWSAVDTHLGRQVAAKVLREEFAGDEMFLERLRTEARNSANLAHPNIAMLHDYGEVDGVGYLVMELVAGEPLSDLLERRRTLPPDQLLPILAQTARALQWRTRPASCTATSSRRTCSSPPTRGSRSPTSASRSARTRRP